MLVIRTPENVLMVSVMNFKETRNYFLIQFYDFELRISEIYEYIWKCKKKLKQLLTNLFIHIYFMFCKKKEIIKK